MATLRQRVHLGWQTIVQDENHRFGAALHIQFDIGAIVAAGEVQVEQFVAIVGGSFQPIERERPERFGAGASEGRIQQGEAPIQVDD